MYKMFMFLSTILHMFFLSSNNPLVLGLILLIQTILTIMIIGKMSFTFWFSYLIFLIFVGGLLILFMYTISLINNSKMIIFKYNHKIMLLYLILLSMYYYKFKKINNYEMNLINNFMNFLNENSINMIKLYNYPNFSINIMMITYLFFIMIVMTKITNFSKGPFFKL